MGPHTIAFYEAPQEIELRAVNTKALMSISFQKVGEGVVRCRGDLLNNLSKYRRVYVRWVR